MKFKKFALGFSEQEVNDFINSHIILKINTLDTGDIYVFFREIEDAQAEINKTELIEELDKLKRTGEIMILTSLIDLDKKVKTRAEIVKNREEAKDDKEFDQLTKDLNQNKLSIKMDLDSIRQKKQDVESYTQMITYLIDGVNLVSIEREAEKILDTQENEKKEA